jgi:hypothetical protein
MVSFTAFGMLGSTTSTLELPAGIVAVSCIGVGEPDNSTETGNGVANMLDPYIRATETVGVTPVKVTGWSGVTTMFNARELVTVKVLLAITIPLPTAVKETLPAWFPTVTFTLVNDAP